MLTELLQLYDKSRINPGPPDCLFVETLLFNEGWLLRAVLKAWKDQAHPAPFGFLPFPSGVHVYSEAQLRTPFKARFRGDSQAEGHAHVDGIVGHFGQDDSRSGVALSPHCAYLAVFEAKMGSPLSQGTANIAQYDQVSRTAACMIHAILQSGCPESLVTHLVVLYPEENRHIDPSRYTQTRVESQIAERTRGYLGSTTRGEMHTEFSRRWREVLDRIQIQFLTWENVVAEIDDPNLGRFYELCRQFN
ncbi:MAG: hypothetical protein R6X16_06095 [Anaerolineae bacterium]